MYLVRSRMFSFFRSAVPACPPPRPPRSELPPRPPRSPRPPPRPPLKLPRSDMMSCAIGNAFVGGLSLHESGISNFESPGEARTRRVRWRQRRSAPPPNSQKGGSRDFVDVRPRLGGSSADAQHGLTRDAQNHQAVDSAGSKQLGVGVRARLASPSAPRRRRTAAPGGRPRRGRRGLELSPVRPLLLPPFPSCRSTPSPPFHHVRR